MNQENEKPPTTEVAEGSEVVRDQRTVSVSHQESPVTLHQSRARGTPQDEAPFIWVSAEALRRVREHTGSASAIAVYMGMACIANDERSPVFQARISRVASMSALRYRATQKQIKLIQLAGIIGVADENNPKGATYTLLSYSGTKGGKLLRHKKHRVEGGTPAREVRPQVPTGSNKLLLSKREEVANKEAGGRNNQQPPDAATPARLDGAGAAGVAETRPAAVKPQPRRW